MRVGGILAFLVLALAACGSSVSLNSPVVPTDATIPNGTAATPQAMLPYFDDYSWRAFLALIWPAQMGQRGVADTKQSVAANAGPKVFETFKAPWEIFHVNAQGKLDPTTPLAGWNQYDSGKYNACQVNPQFGDLVLASFSKFSDMGEATFNALDGPLIAQNGTYVHYLTGYNHIEFSQIKKNKLYLAGATTSFASGALSVKSAWMEMSRVAHPERYYVRDAWVLDPNPDPQARCTKMQVGLVGLHIVQKTPTRPQWIWSTFEQVDNAPDAPGSTSSFAFYKPGAGNMPTSNPYAFQPFNPSMPPWPPPAPYNVERVKPIHASTAATNAAYRQALQAAGSVWQYYQLVMTQFPIQPNQSGTIAATPDYTFPGTGNDSTAFANTTMETFMQTSVGQGCMACHRSNCLDFVCSLPARASGHINMSLQLAK